jgi:hypothetical protein
VAYRVPTGPFAGIGGKSQSTLATGMFATEQPLRVSEAPGTMDLIGDEGSACPGLLPLHILRNLKAGVLCDISPHGDGLMVAQMKASNGVEYAGYVQIPV